MKCGVDAMFVKVKKICSIILSVAVLFSCGTTDVLAAENGSESFSTWDGNMSEVLPIDNVYMIDSANELAWFASSVNSGADYTGKKVIITGNIDLAGKEWTPIGNGQTFSGEIIIEDCYIEGLSCGNDYSGLFGKIILSKFYVDNLIIDESRLQKNANSMGLLAGHMCILEDGNIQIRNSCFGGNVKNSYSLGTGPVGSIFGKLEFLGPNTEAIFEKNNIYTSIVSSATAGGMIGVVEDSNSYGNLVLAKNCISNTVKASCSYGYNETRVGGMIGESTGGNIYIDECQVEGAISSKGYAGYAGGFIGFGTYTILQIENSYVTSDIESNFNGWYGAKYNGGGFLGYSNCINYAGSYIKNCYFAGHINSGVAFMAHDTSSTNAIPVMNCYVDKTVSGLSNSTLAGYGKNWGLMTNNLTNCAAYTTEQMKESSNYADWDFENIWFYQSGRYPLLRENIMCELNLHITDSLGHPLCGTKVTVYNGEEEIETFVADENGIVSLGLELKSEEANIVCSALYFENKEISVVTDQMSYDLHIPMSLTATDMTEQEAVEINKFVQNLPHLSEESAKQFLGFVYNIGDYQNLDYSNNEYYRLLIGDYSEVKSVEELKAECSAFSLFVRETMNKQAANSSYIVDYLTDDLYQYCMEQYEGMSGVDEQVIEAVNEKLHGYIQDAIEGLLCSELAQYSGIVITDEILSNARSVLSIKNDVLSLPNRISQYVDNVVAGVEVVILPIETDVKGRSMYFNSYLSNRGDYESPDDAVFLTIMEYNQFAISDNTYFSNIIDFTTWITGKDSWNEHTAEIDEWAECLYQFEEAVVIDQHDYKEEVVLPTCKQEGYTLHTCITCDRWYTDSETEKSDSHVWGDGIIEISPTCLTEGMIVYTCEICGTTLSESIDKLEHTIVEDEGVAPTCMEKGLTTGKHCSECGTIIEKQRSIAATGHNYNFQVLVEPTYTQEGMASLVCENCGDTYTQTISVLGHTEHVHTQVKNKIEATCEEKGYSGDIYCWDCGILVDEGNVVNALGHTGGVATCKRLAICEKCGKEYGNLDNNVHENTELYGAIEAMCTIPGYTGDIYCLDCGIKIASGESIDALGHIWDEGKITKEPTETEKGMKTYTCIICDEMKIEELAIIENEDSQDDTTNHAPYYSLSADGGTWDGIHYTKTDGTVAKDVFFFDGSNTYYLQADGTPMKDRLTYHPDGEHIIYLDSNGHEVFNSFQYCPSVGYTCYFDSNGYIYKDQITFVGDKTYYLNGNGKMENEGWFQFANGRDFGYANWDGTLNTGGFSYDPWGRVVFYHWNGMVARGLITDGQWYYLMDETDGHYSGSFPVN